MGVQVADERFDNDEEKAGGKKRKEDELRKKYGTPEAHTPSSTDDMRTVPEGSPRGGAGRDLEDENLPYGPARDHDVPGVGPEGTPPGHGGPLPGIGRRKSKWRDELGMEAATEGIDEPDDIAGEEVRKPKKTKMKQERVGSGPKDKNKKSKKKMEGDHDYDGEDEVVEDDERPGKGKGKGKGKGGGKGKDKKGKKGKGAGEGEGKKKGKGKKKG